MSTKAAVTEVLDNAKAYSETCNILRHYSNASFIVRSGSIANGLVMLTLWVNAMNQPPINKAHALGLPIAGIFFTILLYRFHMGYFRATQFFYEEAVKMEKKLFDETFRPLTAYHIQHATWYRSFSARLFTLNAPFVLMGAFFAIALLLGIGGIVFNGQAPKA